MFPGADFVRFRLFGAFRAFGLQFGNVALRFQTAAAAEAAIGMGQRQFTKQMTART
jgi:hypothetical protein